MIYEAPGGKIGVYTGLFRVAESPDQLAAVIGHEMAHVIAKHANARVSAAMAAETGLTIAGLATATGAGTRSSGRDSGEGAEDLIAAMHEAERSLRSAHRHLTRAVKLAR